MNNNNKMIHQPIFLVGAERSGTTLLRLMLDHHPQLAFNYEFEFVVDQIQGGEFPEIPEFIDYLETDRIFQSSGFSIDPELTYPELINSFLLQWQQVSGKPFVGATVHRNFDRLLKIWPDARFIHLVRDPRDVARSCIQMNWAGNTYEAVESWIDAEKLWDDLATIVHDDARVELHYESLVTNPVSCLTEICKLIGIDYDPAMFSYVENSSYDLPKANLAYQWRKKASEKNIRQVEAKVGGLLEQKGYKKSGLPTLKVNAYHDRFLVLQSRAITKLSRIKLYGLPLVMSSWLANKLKLTRWMKRTRLELNKIDTELLK